MSYRLIYWPGLPGRGEFARLVLEESGAAYEDTAQGDRQDALEAMKSALSGAAGGLPALAPPVLQHDALFIAQSGNICEYVAARHGLAPADEGQRALARQLQATVADLVSETHDTHHPVAIGKYYEDQLAEALEASAHFREVRLPKFLGYFERVLEQSGGEWLLGAFSYPDLALFQVVEGLKYAFPIGTGRTLEALPLLTAHAARVAARPRIAAYLASERRQTFNANGIFRAYPELDG